MAVSISICFFMAGEMISELGEAWGRQLCRVLLAATSVHLNPIQYSTG